MPGYQQIVELLLILDWHSCLPDLGGWSLQAGATIQLRVQLSQAFWTSHTHQPSASKHWACQDMLTLLRTCWMVNARTISLGQQQHELFTEVTHTRNLEIS